MESKILRPSITIEVDAWDDNFPIIPTQCFICESYFDKHKTKLYRKVAGYSFNAHLITLECQGNCGMEVIQAWHREGYGTENPTNKYTLHSICIKKKQPEVTTNG
jgi:hypothetical protein